MDIKDWYTSLFLKQANIDITGSIISQYRPFFWRNLRINQHSGLRLTDNGLAFIIEKAEIKVHEITLQQGTMFTPQLLVWLDKY
jgi:hypothetical protein